MIWLQKYKEILNYLPQNKIICLILMQNEADNTKMRQIMKI